MDESGPTLALLITLFPSQNASALWTLVAAWLVAILASLYRSALLDASRSRILEEQRDSKKRSRVERAFQDQDRIEVSLALVQLVAEVWFVLATGLQLPHDPSGRGISFGEPGSLERHGFTFLLSVVILFPTVHALPQGLTGRGYAERILSRALVPLFWLSYVFLPVSLPLLRLRGRALVLFRSEQVESKDQDKELIQSEIIDVVEEGERRGALEQSEASMIGRVMSLQDLTVSEVMTPRTDLTCVSIDKSLEEACRICHEEGHSKIPVFRKNRDNICGIFQIRDAIPFWTNGRDSPPALKDLLRKPYFVPETKKVAQLLREFQENEEGMAIVLDEYGGTAGVITVEDILEEIVGEIREQHDQEETLSIEKQGMGEFVIDARLRIENVNEELNVRLPESEDYDTLGGFVFAHLDRIPEPHDRFEFEGIQFEVLEVDQRRLVRLKVTVPEVSPQSDVL